MFEEEAGILAGGHNIPADNLDSTSPGETKWWSYLVEGLLSMGPTPSSFCNMFALDEASFAFK